MSESNNPLRARTVTGAFAFRDLTARGTARGTPSPYLPHGPDALLYPEGAVSEEAVELLHEFVQPKSREARRESRP